MTKEVGGCLGAIAIGVIALIVLSKYFFGIVVSPYRFGDSRHSCKHKMVASALVGEAR